MKLNLIIKNIDTVVESLKDFIKDQIQNNFNRKGVVIGISGGIDSAVVAALCVKALGSDKVLGLIMPEKDSNPQSRLLAELFCNKFNIKTETIDLTPILEKYDIYNIRDNIVRKNFPNFNTFSKYRLVIPNNLENEGISLPFLQVLDKENNIHDIKLGLNDYLNLTAATSIKLRSRMIMSYYHAEKNHYAVIGTTNKTELVQGYFVKYGDGGVDIEPIANLYKTQVYQLGKYLGIPDEIIQRKASPDTWSFEVSDQEFFFGLPYDTIDMFLHAQENKIPLNTISESLNLSNKQLEKISSIQKRKWSSSKHMRESPPIWDAKIISLAD